MGISYEKARLNAHHTGIVILVSFVLSCVHLSNFLLRMGIMVAKLHAPMNLAVSALRTRHFAMTLLKALALK